MLRAALVDVHGTFRGYRTHTKRQNKSYARNRRCVCWRTSKKVEGTLCAHPLRLRRNRQSFVDAKLVRNHRKQSTRKISTNRKTTKSRTRLEIYHRKVIIHQSSVIVSLVGFDPIIGNDRMTEAGLKIEIFMAESPVGWSRYSFPELRCDNCKPSILSKIEIVAIVAREVSAESKRFVRQNANFQPTDLSEIARKSKHCHADKQ